MVAGLFFLAEMKFDRKKFFQGFRERIDPTIEQEQVSGLEFLLGQMESDPFWKYIPQISYAFATTYHETAGSFQPVEEAYYLEKQYSRAFMLKTQKGFRYYPYFGRGYPQTTWLTNYKRADRELKKQRPDLVAQFESETKQKLDLINKPEQMKHPVIAYATMTLGMHQGWFTGKKLDDFIKGSKKDYPNARTIINRHDKAGLIAGYARAFERILNDSALTSTAAVQHSAKEVDSQKIDNFIAPPGQTELPPSNNQESSEVTAKRETDTPTGTESVEVTKKNEQNVNEVATVEGPKPYNDVGLKATLIGDAKPFLPANGGLQMFSEYAQQATGWPPWVIGLIGKAAIILLVITVAWFLYRIATWVLHNWRENERVKLSAQINSDVTRKNVEFTAPEVK